MGRFLPPAALQSEVARTARILDRAAKEHEASINCRACRIAPDRQHRNHQLGCHHLLACCCVLQKAVEELVRAQARLDHARNGQAAKQAARDAAATKKADVEEELQVGGGGVSPSAALPARFPARLGAHGMQPMIWCGNRGANVAPLRMDVSLQPPPVPLPVPLPHCRARCPCPPPVQAAKLFAEHFAAVWERKERESGLAAQQLHRSEVGDGRWLGGRRLLLPMPGKLHLLLLLHFYLGCRLLRELWRRSTFTPVEC